jgi:hypothetical protein
VIGTRGSAEVREKTVPIGNQPVNLPRSDHQILDLDPVAGSYHQWLGLCSQGSIVSIDTRNSTVRAVAQVAPIPEPGHDPWCDHALFHRLHASHDGEYIAVVNDYGQRGIVAEVATGRVTMELNGGDHFPDTVPFSLCFTSYEGQPVLIHRTDWNRLDLSNPATGRLLSDRNPTSYEREEQRPPHYLEYFHGRLYASTDGKWILDDGWIWHPIGVPAVWSLERWLGGNVWESEEDGPSRRELCVRNFWNEAACWLDGRRVVIAGLGDDEGRIVPGARVFELSGDTWRESGAFGGPSGCFFSDGSRLFSSDQAGLSIWDIEHGVRVGHVPGFAPQRMHPSSHEFIEISEEHLRIWQPAALPAPIPVNPIGKIRLA